MLDMEANTDPSELQPLGAYDFEKNFDHLAARKWMAENWQKSFIYLISVFGIQHFVKKRRPFNLCAPLTLWSFSMTLFSFIAACWVWKQMAFLLCTKGLKRSVTLFIVLRKKKLLFIHWCHHLATLILIWHGYKHMAISVGWNAALNLCVHCLMDCYYTVTAMGIRVPNLHCHANHHFTDGAGDGISNNECLYLLLEG